MRVKHWNMAIVSAAVLVIGGGVFAAASLRTQPAGGDPLPDGFSRDATTGDLIATSPPSVRFDTEANKAAVINLTSNLPVGSFSLNSDGSISSFTLNSRLGTYPDGTELLCRSVTLNSDGTLDSLVLSESAVDSGCDMKVTIDGGVTTFKCEKTSCTTECDAKSTKDPVTGKIDVFCVCRTAP